MREIQHTGSLVEHPFIQSSYVRDVAFSEDGDSLFLTSDGFTRYDWRSQKVEQTLVKKGKSSGISRSSISPDHRYFARFYGSVVAIHDLTSGAELDRVVGKYKRSTAHDWSPDSKIFAFGGNGEVLLWDLEKKKLSRKVSHGGEMIDSIAFSKNGEMLAVANTPTGEGGGVRLHSLNGGGVKELEGGNEFLIRDALLRFSPDGKWLALSSELQISKRSLRPTVKLWDIETGRLLWVKNTDCNVIEFSSDSQEMFLGKLASFEIIKPKSGEAAFEYRGFPMNRHVWDAEYSRDGKYIAIALGNGALVWERGKQRNFHAQGVHKGSIDAVDFSSCGKFVASGDKSGKVVLWSWPEKNVFWETTKLTEAMTKFGLRRSFGVQDLTICKTGKLLCVVNSCSGHSLHTLDLKTGEIVASFGGFSRATTSPVFSEDGGKVYLGMGRGRIQCWDAFTGELMNTYVLSDSAKVMNKIGEVSELILNPNDSSILCWSSRSRVMGIIDLSTNKVTIEQAVNSSGRGFFLSPHKEWIARGSYFCKLRGKHPVKWKYPKQLDRLEELASHARIASILNYGSIYLVDMLHYKPFCHVRTPRGKFTDCAFSPDARYLVTASTSGLRYVDLYQSTEIKELADHSIEQLWKIMESQDAYLAYRATWALSQRSEAIDYLKNKILPHSELSDEKLQKFYQQLADEQQTVALLAARELIDSGVGLSKERLELLRRPIDEPWYRGLPEDQIPLGPVPKLMPLKQRLRESRGLMALELISSEDAVALMQKVAEGAAVHPTSREAKYSKLLRK